MLTSYSYAKLSVRFPNQGGTVIFVDQAFGRDLFTGSLNVLLWLSYIIMLSLYSYAFGTYGAALFGMENSPFAKHLLISVSVIGLNRFEYAQLLRCRSRRNVYRSCKNRIAGPLYRDRIPRNIN